MFKGVTVALVTPFRDGKIDWPSYEALIESQIEAGVDTLLPSGCTGEAATLTHEEQKQLVEFVVQCVKGRAKVMAGTGSNSYEEALSLTRYAKEVGADGALLITPYYNKPTQNGLYRYYHGIAEAVDIPIVLYNVPGRCGVSLTARTVAQLSTHKNIVAIKEATGTVQLADGILHECDIMVLSGDDALTVPMMSIGGQGVVSVLSNIAPRQVVALVRAMESGDTQEALRLHKTLYALNKGLFVTTNPIPVKMILALQGKIQAEFREPLGVEVECEEFLKNLIKDYSELL